MMHFVATALSALDAKERQNWINVLRLVSQAELGEYANTSGNTKANTSTNESEPSLTPPPPPLPPPLLAHSSGESEAPRPVSASHQQQHLSPPTSQLPRLTNLDLIKEIYNHVKMSNQMLENVLIVSHYIIDSCTKISVSQ